MNWKDDSSYSQHDKERIPRIYNAKLTKDFVVTVHRHIHYAPDMWLLTCEPFFKQKELCTGSAEEAQTMAKILVRNAVVMLYNTIKE